MPVRSLNSPVLRWPDQVAVANAVRQWATAAAAARPDVLCIGYFGSYARGDWGVGSDVDLIVLVENSDQPFERRAVQWPADNLPVPADVLVYTRAEWESRRPPGALRKVLERETVWVFRRAT